MNEAFNLDSLRQRDVIIFGAGYYGRICYEYLKKHNITTSFFVDNNTELVGTRIGDAVVCSVSQLGTTEKDKLGIVISSKNYISEITEQICGYGIDIRAITTYECLINGDSSKIISQCEETIDNQFKSFAGCENKLKILYDGQPFSFQKRGGVSRYFYEIISRSAQRNDFGVVFFEGLNISEIDFGDVSDEFHNYFSWNSDLISERDLEERYRINRNIIRYYIEMVDKFDLYHPTYYKDLGSAKYNKMVITIHDMIHEIFNLDRKTVNDKKNIVAKTNGIIAVSESTKADLINILKIPESKIRVIHEANSLKIPLQKKRLIAEPYILYVGERKGYKNFSKLAKAFSSIKARSDIKLVCFGGGKFLSEELSLFSELGIEKQVEFYSGEDLVLANLYQYAEIFVYPSLYEGFGLPILEAMHYGTPVITGNTSSMPEVGGDAAEYFNPDSDEELVYKIESLLDDTARRNQLSELGITREKMFSWDKCANEIFDYYYEVLGR